jgi:hypothetical protein
VLAKKGVVSVRVLNTPVAGVGLIRQDLDISDQAPL